MRVSSHPVVHRLPSLRTHGASSFSFPKRGTGAPFLGKGCEGDEHALDHYILLTVRLDLLLIELCNSLHAFLGRTVLATGFDSEEELIAMRSESEQRVKKSLKHVAFYSQFFLSSDKKYLGHHLFVQLVILPGWTTLATQREGSVDRHVELSEEELD